VFVIAISRPIITFAVLHAFQDLINWDKTDIAISDGYYFLYIQSLYLYRKQRLHDDNIIMLSMITTSSFVVLNMIYEQALPVSARARAGSAIW